MPLIMIVYSLVNVIKRIILATNQPVQMAVVKLLCQMVGMMRGVLHLIIVMEVEPVVLYVRLRGMNLYPYPMHGLDAR